MYRGPPCPVLKTAAVVRSQADPAASYLQHMHPLQQAASGNALAAAVVGDIRKNFCTLCTTIICWPLPNKDGSLQTRTWNGNGWEKMLQTAFPHQAQCVSASSRQEYKPLAYGLLQCSSTDNKTLEVDFRLMVKSDRMWRAGDREGTAC
jgi:hypothetical protein